VIIGVAEGRTADTSLTAMSARQEQLGDSFERPGCERRRPFIANRRHAHEFREEQRGDRSIQASENEGSPGEGDMLRRLN